ncbi:MAG: hypothetical protein GXO74_13355 [Calditrichaeota bacterium]|nr:hypothetical protein [Calditrichota bacterium]
MAKNWLDLIGAVDKRLFLLAVSLFFIGFFLASPVVKFSIKFLMAYPLWMWGKLEQFLRKKPSFFTLAIFIFLFNSISSFLNILSGFGVVLPFIFTFWLGLNVGIIARKEAGGMAIAVTLFLSPHAFFELPAVWLSATAGMQLALAAAKTKEAAIAQYHYSLDLYFFVILILLLLAAFIEAGMIYLVTKKSKHPEFFSQEPFDREQDDSDDEKNELMP